MRKVKERDIQKQIKEYLQLKGWVVIKAPTSGIFKKSTNAWIPLGQKGISDLLCCPPWGQFVAIEVKRKGNTLTAYQAVFLEQIRANKGLAFVVYSLEELEGIIEKYKEAR